MGEPKADLMQKLIPTFSPLVKACGYQKKADSRTVNNIF
jgi:hypothetical protein